MSDDNFKLIVFVVIILGMVSLAAPVFIAAIDAPQDKCGNIYPGADAKNIKDPNPWCKIDDVRRGYSK